MVNSTVLLIIILLAFVEADFYTGIIIFGMFSYLLIYIMRLIHILEKPFRKGKDDTCDDVSIFLLRELSVRLNSKSNTTL